jgi:hypothetical protein
LEEIFSRVTGLANVKACQFVDSGTLKDLQKCYNHEVVEMLDQQTRGAILLLHRKGHSLRRISCLLSLSRDCVRKVVRAGSDEPQTILRPRKLDAHRERIARMLVEFDGNLVKVHRALTDAGTSVRYSTLSRFCRNTHLLNRACDPHDEGRPLALHFREGEGPRGIGQS